MKNFLFFALILFVISCKDYDNTFLGSKNTKLVVGSVFTGTDSSAGIYQYTIKQYHREKIFRTNAEEWRWYSTFTYFSDSLYKVGETLKIDK